MAKSRLFNIRLREEEWEIFDQIATETGLNYAQIVRQRVFKEGDVVSEKLDNIELTLEEIKSAVCDK